jgi:hypothetical protein
MRRQTVLQPWKTERFQGNNGMDYSGFTTDPARDNARALFCYEINQARRIATSTMPAPISSESFAASATKVPAS